MATRSPACLALGIALAVAAAAPPCRPGRADPAARDPLPAPTGAAPQAAAPDPFVNFNFEDVDLRFLVRLVGELTGRRFVVDKEVEGKITVVTPPQIPIGEVYPLFLAILEAAGGAVVEQNGICRIVSREKRPMPIAPVLPEGAATPREGIITKVIPVQHVRASDLRRLLEPMVDQGKTGALGVLEATNCLILTDTAASLRRIETLIAQLDRPGLARATELVALQYANADAVAAELNAAMAGVAARADTPGDRLRQRLPRPGETGSEGQPGEALVIAAPHSNSLILIGAPAQLAEVKRLIARLDTEPRGGYGHLKALFLKYLSAEEAAKTLTALISKRAEKPQDQKISIECSPGNNALLIDAAPADFTMVKELVEQLDQPPQQVLIEVMIAELTLSDGRELGAEFLAAGQPAEGSTIALGGLRTAEGDDRLMDQVVNGVVPNGLTFGLARGSYTDANGNVVPRFPALLNILALRQQGTFKILSNIPLWTQNNQPATVTIGKNIPILKSTVSGGSGTARDYIENIDRVDVGIKLSVTPHVNPTREVRMQLNPSIEAILESSTGGKAFTPTIAKREVTTTLTVPDGDTVVISGLMREDTVTKERKIPFLGAIPLLGWLFRTRVEAAERTNLLLFVTPHVATNAAAAQALTGMIQSKTTFRPGSSNLVIRPLDAPPQGRAPGGAARD